MTPMTQSSEEFETLRWTLVGMYLCVIGGICLLLAVHVHLIGRFLMNGDEGVGNAPCTFCSLCIPDRGMCKQSFTDLIFVTILMSGSHYLP
jgi:hypothetical protein